MKPLLADSLSVILPTPEETLLLRACLLPDELGRVAWRRWREQVGDPLQVLRSDGQVLKRWLPLLHHNLRAIGVTPERPFQTLLRSAYLKEQLRCQAIRPVVQQTLSLLKREGIEPIVLKGEALAESVYPDPALRHCHDIDLLVRGADLERIALAGMPGLGVDKVQAGSRGDLALVHESGLPIQFHTSLFPQRYYPTPAGIWDQTIALDIGGVEARMLSPELSTLHVCGHAACSSSRESLAWVCDSVLFLRAHSQLDWESFYQLAVASRLALPLSLMLNYLAGELGAPIPDRVLERLDGEAARADSARQEAALYASRMTARGNWRSLMRRASGRRERITIFKYLVKTKLSSL